MNWFSKKKIVPVSEITPDVLTYWQRKYQGGFFEISIADKVGYFRSLTAKEIETELKIFSKKQTTAAGKEADAVNFSMRLIELSMLGGDVEILTNEPYKTAVLNQVGDVVLKDINNTLPHLGVK